MGGPQPPNKTKQMISEALYPKIYAPEPKLAVRITGMLLKLDDAELISLTKDNEALANKVKEAKTVYDENDRSNHGQLRRANFGSIFDPLELSSLSIAAQMLGNLSSSIIHA